MKFKNLTPYFIIAILFQACIGNDVIDDFVEPNIRITNPIDTIGFEDTYQFEATYFNNVGLTEDLPVFWSSSDENIISITETGLATAINTGDAIISAEVTNPDGSTILNDLPVSVGAMTVIAEVPVERTGTVMTTTFYDLEGDFTLAEAEEGMLTLTFDENYLASAGLPGLYIYLTNNPNTISGAFEIGRVDVFEGEHSYEIPSSVGIMDYQYILYFCKPFNVKVGDGEFDN